MQARSLRLAVATVLAMVMLAAVGFNEYVAVMKVVNAKPLLYMDVAMLFALPAGYVAGLLSLSLTFGFRPVALLGAFLPALVAMMIATALIGVLQIHLPFAIPVCLLSGAIAGVGVVLDSARRQRASNSVN